MVVLLSWGVLQNAATAKDLTRSNYNLLISTFILMKIDEAFTNCLRDVKNV